MLEGISMHTRPLSRYTNRMEKRRKFSKKGEDWLAGFIKCGIAGWCMEILVTSAESVAMGDMRLMGRTSLLMFPIYGLGVLLRPIGRWMDEWIGDGERIQKGDRFWRHGICAMVLIFAAEYATGFLLKKLGICPWDYSGRLFSVDGLIRVDFAPCWFFAGRLFEHLTKNTEEEFGAVQNTGTRSGGIYG